MSFILLDDVFNRTDGVGSFSLKSSLILLYQEEYQKKLMRRYGSELAILDTPSNTIEYLLPFFFVAVKTNVDYQVVATFVCETETKEVIEEAITILKCWNFDWNPRCFMTYYSKETMDVINNLLGMLSIDFNAHYSHMPQCHVKK